jgi:hypothetical protein
LIQCDLYPSTFQTLQVAEFVCGVFGFKSLYGLQPETLDSLILDFLPPLSHTYQQLGQDSVVDDSQEVSIYLIQEMLGALRNNAGFHIPKVSTIAPPSILVPVISLPYPTPSSLGVS